MPRKQRRRPRWMKLYRGWLYCTAARLYRQTSPHASAERICVYEPWKGKYRFIGYMDIRGMVRMINRELRMRPPRRQEK